MAVETSCQTPGAQYITTIWDTGVSVRVEFPNQVFFTEEEAEILDANMHNAMELALAAVIGRK